MAERIHLESPSSAELDTPLNRIIGWCTSDVSTIQPQLWINGLAVELALRDRPDVRRVFPDRHSKGFECRLPPELCLSVSDQPLRLRISLGSAVVERELRYSRAAVEKARAFVRAKADKRAFCLEILRCPTCRAARPTLDSSNMLVCPGCGTALPQSSGALNLLPDALYREFQLKPTGSVSAHPYPPEAVALIENTRRAGGKTLDCGAGYRALQDDSVVNMEIVDYESTDVLAVGQSLPFQDESFDSVLSLAVLEHVDDPFTCAAELVRVVKRGGKILCVVPFLQHEHGYPNHFYNMTRQGLVNLFNGKAQVLSHDVPGYGAPIHSLCSFIQAYLGELPPDVRPDFENLTVRELAAMKRTAYAQQPFVQKLSAEGNFRLASVTAAVLQRI